jgi:hypothetical protein
MIVGGAAETARSARAAAAMPIIGFPSARSLGIEIHQRFSLLADEMIE